jgi:hypothetical protein
MTWFRCRVKDRESSCSPSPVLLRSIRLDRVQSTTGWPDCPAEKPALMVHMEGGEVLLLEGEEATKFDRKFVEYAGHEGYARLLAAD